MLKSSLEEYRGTGFARIDEDEGGGGKTLALDIQKRLKVIEEKIAAVELIKELPLSIIEKN